MMKKKLLAWWLLVAHLLCKTVLVGRLGAPNCGNENLGLRFESRIILTRFRFIHLLDR